MIRIALVSVAFAFAPVAFAQAPPPFVASRPGSTEGAIAVPKGYLQAETELASWARTRDSGFKADSYSLAATSLRYGLGDGLDVELNFAPYLRSRETFAGSSDTVDGFGDVTLRVLKNLMGQDGDGPALAVIGFVTLPTASDGLGPDKAEGGAIITGSFDVGSGFGASWTLGAAARNMSGNDYQGELSGAFQLNHAFGEAVTGYAEVAASRAEHDGGPIAATFDVGAAWLVGDTTQLDAGANFGLTDTADDFQIFVGWAHRF